MTQFTLEVARAAMTIPQVEPTISVSRQSKNFSEYTGVGIPLHTINTFETSLGSIFQSYRIPFIRKKLRQRLLHDRTQAVIELMPHVWSPFIMPVVKETGARYCTIVHDASPHPGDQTAWVKPILDRCADSADLILTLSSSVTNKLQQARNIPAYKLHTLFHPNLSYGSVNCKTPPMPGSPWKLLFLGRIMPYKGLGLLLDAFDMLRYRGLDVELGVFGEGFLGSHSKRLSEVGATVVNRWLTEQEIQQALQQYHVVVLSHLEASQSGVAASAFGAGVPVIGTPVGGLVEQINNGHNGFMAKQVDVESLAEAIGQLLHPSVYNEICLNLMRSSSDHSMERFITDIVEHPFFANP